MELLKSYFLILCLIMAVAVPLLLLVNRKAEARKQPPAPIIKTDRLEDL